MGGDETPAETSLKSATSPARRISTVGSYASRKSSAARSQSPEPLQTHETSRTPEPTRKRSASPVAISSVPASNGQTKQASRSPSTGSPTKAKVLDDSLGSSGGHGREFSTGDRPRRHQSTAPMSSGDELLKTRAKSVTPSTRLRPNSAANLASSQSSQKSLTSVYFTAASSPLGSRKSDSKSRTQEEIFNENMMHPSSNSSNKRLSTRPTKNNRRSMMPGGGKEVIEEVDSNPNLLEIEPSSAPVTNNRLSKMPLKKGLASAPATKKRASRIPLKNGDEADPIKANPLANVNSHSNNELDDFADTLKKRIQAEQDSPLDQFRIKEPDTQTPVFNFSVQESAPFPDNYSLGNSSNAGSVHEDEE
jgi:hypothetical protein